MNTLVSTVLCLVTVNGFCFILIWTWLSVYQNKWKNLYKNNGSAQGYPFHQGFGYFFLFIAIEFLRYWQRNTMPIRTTMSIVVMMCTLSTKRPGLLKSCSGAVGSSSFCFCTNKYRSNFFSDAVWLHFFTWNKLLCLISYCFEQS